MTMSDAVPLKVRLSEFKYWHYTRHAQKIPLKLANLLPARIKYWVYISVTAEVTTGDLKQAIVPEVTAMEVLDSYSMSHSIH